MKRLFIFISLITLLNGCFKTPVKTGAISEENRINLSSLAIGMTQQQVLDVMGYPYKTEEKISQNKIYEVWNYITEPTLLGQSRLITRNFTPLVFEGGHLIGWGRNFYKYTFDIDDERLKREEEKRQRYTNDKEEWPKNEHTMIGPLGAQKTAPASTSEATSAPIITPASSNETSSKANILEIDSKKEGEKPISPIKTDVKKEQLKSSEIKAEKPPCCTEKAVKTNACDKCKKTKSESTIPSEKPKAQKEPSDEKKVSPCKDRKDTDENYNFWE